MSLEEAEAAYETARAALQAFDEKATQTTDALNEERAQVNAQYQAAEDALLIAQRDAAGPNDAPTQTVGG